MKHPPPGGRRLRVLPGEFQATAGPAVIQTLLGSCVAACLYDPGSGVAGMNHFLLAERCGSHEAPLCLSEGGRYGIHAMELLINEMLRRGASRSRLRCKAFGGANVLAGCGPGEGGLETVGSVNERFIREFLRQEGIPLVAADLGGASGRVIYFDSRDHAVYVRRIGPRRIRDVADRERALLEEQLARQARKTGKIDLW